MKKSRFNKPVKIRDIRQIEDGWSLEIIIDEISYSCEATYEEYVDDTSYNKLAWPTCEIHLRIEYKEDCPSIDSLIYGFNQERSRYGYCNFTKEEGIKGVFNPHLNMYMRTRDEKITLFKYDTVWNRTGPYPRQEFVGVGPFSKLWLKIRRAYNRQIWEAEHKEQKI